jgi:hypothetical protein
VTRPSADIVSDERCIDMRRNVADHEVFLSFNSDRLAEQFREWLDCDGWNRYVRWVTSGQ